MSKKDEALKLALEALKQIDEAMPFPVAKLAQAALREALAEQPAQQEPVAYDKTELNCFAQDLYDQKMREGKHGHYESMFHVIHQCVKKVASPPAQRKPQEFVCSTGLCHYRKPLSDEEIDELWRELPPDTLLSDELNAFARAIEAAHGIGEKK